MATQNKTVVFITGANSGIGYETVRALAQSSRSYHVFFGSRSVEKGKEAAKVLQQEFPASTIVMDVIQIDVSSDESINAACDQVENSLGYVDVLINNAGMWAICI
jgi:NAD(P)-dependent dehydrogenase (short-subunit alcohol dehydrogenase family)